MHGEIIQTPICTTRCENYYDKERNEKRYEELSFSLMVSATVLLLVKLTYLPAGSCVAAASTSSESNAASPGPGATGAPCFDACALHVGSRPKITSLFAKQKKLTAELLLLVVYATSVNSVRELTQLSPSQIKRRSSFLILPLSSASAGTS